MSDRKSSSEPAFDSLQATDRLHAASHQLEGLLSLLLTQTVCAGGSEITKAVLAPVVGLAADLAKEVHSLQEALLQGNA